MAYEIEAIELDEMSGKPVHVEIKVNSYEYNLDVSVRLTALLKRFPGNDSVSLLYTQGDGRRFKAALPLTIDSHSNVLRLELSRMFGRDVL